MEFTQENLMYAAVIIASVVAVILNYMKLNKETVNIYFLTRSQFINILSIVLSVFTAAIFAYTLLAKDDDFLILGYIFGVVSVFTNAVSAAYHLELIKNE
jgi:predicted neutral ceramidase superfamily lipid hydrolase